MMATEWRMGFRTNCIAVAVERVNSTCEINHGQRLGDGAAAMPAEP